MAELPNYDAWLEAPYQRNVNEDECPDCGAPVHVEGDKYEWSAVCTNDRCDFTDGWSHPDI
jgi:hypothetical protein